MEQPAYTSHFTSIHQMVHTTLRRDITSGEFVSELRWRTFITPPIEIVMPALTIAIQQSSFWRVMAKRSQLERISFCKHVPDAQRNTRLISEKSTIIAPPLATELKLLREVCTEFRNNIPFVKAASIMTYGFYSTRQHMERRFGISKRQSLKLQTYTVGAVSNLVHVPDVLEMMSKNQPVLSVQSSLAMHSKIARNNREKYVTHQLNMKARNTGLQRKRAMIEGWLASEGMAIVGPHLTYGLKSTENIETLKPFIRRIYYVHFFLKEEYKEHVDYILTEDGLNFQVNQNQARERATEHCFDKCSAINFCETWPVIWQQVCFQILSSFE